MGFFKNQFLDVIEWNETRDDVLFWLWRNKEIKKNSRLVIRPGQDAIFLYNGRIEGIFKDEGNYEIETDIIPFLSTLKGFKFGFNSGIRAEILFINTKEFLVKWGTRNSINIPTPRMPGGLPIRAFGAFNVKINDYLVLIDKIAGVKQQFTVDDVKDRTVTLLDQLLMKWITREGKDLFNLQANAYDISKGIKDDLDMELIKIGLSVSDFTVSSFSYPENIQKMVEKNASYEMVGDLGRYQNIGAIDAMGNGSNGMANMAGAGMGMAMGMEMAKSFKRENEVKDKNLCIKCGTPLVEGAKFCSGCGEKVESSVETKVEKKKFCSECGAKVNGDSKFCNQCGNKID